MAKCTGCGASTKELYECDSCIRERVKDECFICLIDIEDQSLKRYRRYGNCCTACDQTISALLLPDD